VTPSVHKHSESTETDSRRQATALPGDRNKVATVTKVHLRSMPVEYGIQPTKYFPIELRKCSLLNSSRRPGSIRPIEGARRQMDSRAQTQLSAKASAGRMFYE
jgi:hypothetical protein